MIGVKKEQKTSEGFALNLRTPLTVSHCASLVTSVASECPYEVSVTQGNAAERHRGCNSAYTRSEIRQGMSAKSQSYNFSY